MRDRTQKMGVGTGGHEMEMDEMEIDTDSCMHAGVVL